jgi:hypothetical protein
MRRLSQGGLESPRLDLTRMRTELLRAARSGEKVTYGELMKRYRLSRGRALTNAIAKVDEKERARGAPGFAAIIVRKDMGFPGGGYFCGGDLPPGLLREPGRSSDPRLTPAERAHLTEQQAKIWAYYREGAARHRPFPRQILPFSRLA